jgi:hypothetical protein
MVSFAVEYLIICFDNQKLHIPSHHLILFNCEYGKWNEIRRTGLMRQLHAPYSVADPIEAQSCEQRINRVDGREAYNNDPVPCCLQQNWDRPTLKSNFERGSL